mmetsp:Transcript_7451/g.27906  ORF Transcript_7451/g.27906 Transcript_7451/m.27906 type:complete len:255 (-) Transcript_7451:2566-3330(-)
MDHQQAPPCFLTLTSNLEHENVWRSMSTFLTNGALTGRRNSRSLIQRGPLTRRSPILGSKRMTCSIDDRETTQTLTKLYPMIQWCMVLGTTIASPSSWTMRAISKTLTNKTTSADRGTSRARVHRDAIHFPATKISKHTRRTKSSRSGTMTWISMPTLLVLCVMRMVCFSLHSRFCSFWSRCGMICCIRTTKRFCCTKSTTASHSQMSRPSLLCTCCGGKQPTMSWSERLFSQNCESLKRRHPIQCDSSADNRL